jgi:hypothetical protein
MYKEYKDPVDDLIHDIERVVESNNIAIIVITKRLSESHYNYTSEIVVAWKPVHEEQLIRRTEVFEVSAGVFQTYPLALGKILEESLKRKGYAVERISIY